MVALPTITQLLGCGNNFYYKGIIIFTGSASSDKIITIDFYGTQAEWDSVKGKTGLSESEYILNLRS
jgi:hypothetical protein